MARWLKQSTATSITIGPLLDYQDGITPQTSVTHASITAGIVKGVTLTSITVTASGGSNDLTSIGSGYWALELTGTDTNTVGQARVFLRDDDDFIACWEDFMVVPANAYDSLVGGSDTLDTSIIQVLGTAVTESSTTPGVLDVNVAEISDDSTAADNLETAAAASALTCNVTQVSGDATAANNLELAYDGTGYAGGATKPEVNVVQLSGQSDSATTLEQLMDSSGDPNTFTVDDATFAPTTTQFEADVTEATDDHFNGNFIRWISGTLKYGTYQITDYDGTNKRFTVATMTEAPMDGDEFVLS